MAAVQTRVSFRLSEAEHLSCKSGCRLSWLHACRADGANAAAAAPAGNYGR